MNCHFLKHKERKDLEKRIKRIEEHLETRGLVSAGRMLF